MQFFMLFLCSLAFHVALGLRRNNGLEGVEIEADTDEMDVLGFFRTMSSEHPAFYRGIGKDVNDTVLREKIAAVKANSQGGGMEEQEYFHFMSYVRDHAPQNLLVWGLGYDSVLLNALNEGGRTVFLEMNVDWVKNTDAAALEYYSYDDGAFKTTVSEAKNFVKHPHRAELAVLSNMPCWDTILVDSPLGYRKSDTGRGVPIYTAKTDIERCIANHKYKPGQQLAVFVHDNNRVSENIFTKAFLGKPVAQIGPKKLREFHFTAA